MIQTILSTLAIFVGSSIEEIPVFVLLFYRANSEVHNKFEALALLGSLLV